MAIHTCVHILQGLVRMEAAEVEAEECLEVAHEHARSLFGALYGEDSPLDPGSPLTHPHREARGDGDKDSLNFDSSRTSTPNQPPTRSNQNTPQTPSRRESTAGRNAQRTGANAASARLMHAEEAAAGEIRKGSSGLYDASAEAAVAQAGSGRGSPMSTPPRRRSRGWVHAKMHASFFLISSIFSSNNLDSGFVHSSMQAITEVGAHTNACMLFPYFFILSRMMD